METESPVLRDYSLVGGESREAVDKGLADADWYKSPVPPGKMQKLLVRKNGPAIRDTLIWFGLIFGSGYLVYYFWGSWLVIFPYVVYSVLYASSSDSRWHESSHGTAFKTDWMNNFLYEVASFMVLRQSTVWRYSHARHHSDTIIRGRDPEIAVTRPADILKIVLIFVGISSSIPEFKKLVRHAAGRIDPQVATYLPRHEYKTVFRKARIYLFIFIAVIGLSVYLQSILPLMYIGLPTLLGSWLMPIYGLTQHAGLAENVLDHRLNCRTVLMNRVHRFLYWNMNYHIEHHMFPLVPYHRLPELHELIKHDCPPPYKSITETYREIIPAIIKQSKDASYFVKRELPKTGSIQHITGDDFFILNENNVDQDVLTICSNKQLVKGGIRRFDFENRTYAIYRTQEDKIYVSDGVCTHGNAHLSEGIIIGETIECAKHNGRFALNDGSPVRPPVCVGLKTYPVQEINGNYCVVVNELSAETKNNGSYQYKVVSNKNVTTYIKELVLEPVNSTKLIYEPGQYAQIEIPKHETYSSDFEIDKQYRHIWKSIKLKANCTNNVKRNYSFATRPSNASTLVFNVRINLPPRGNSSIDAGHGSSYIFRLKEGDVINLKGAYGNFLIKDTQNEMVYLGGGSGMAPLKAHISHLLETLNTNRKISFWYGARTKQDLFYTGYFEKLQAEHDNFSFQQALSAPLTNDNWEGDKGFIHEVLLNNYLKNHANPEQIEYYLCGPPALIRAGMEMLEKLGVEKSNIAFDEF